MILSAGACADYSYYNHSNHDALCRNSGGRDGMFFADEVGKVEGKLFDCPADDA